MSRTLPRLRQRLRRQAPAAAPGALPATSGASSVSSSTIADGRSVVVCSNRPGAVRADRDQNVRREASREARRCGQDQDRLQHSSLLSGIRHAVNGGSSRPNVASGFSRTNTVSHDATHLTK